MRRNRLNMIAQGLALLLCAVALPGCWVELSRTNAWSHWEDLAARFPDRGYDDSLVDAQGQVRQPRQQTGWSILLKAYDGPRAQRHAEQLSRLLISEAHLPDLWMRTVGNRVEVLRGRYLDPQDPKAQQDLRQTQMVEVDGARPYANVSLIPLSDLAQGGATEHDLRLYPGFYSLQIAFYDEAFGPNYKQAAEQMVKVLRADGDEAYYYHGPNRSMVTVGIFTDADFADQALADGRSIKVYGPRIREMQEKYPRNLGNGRTVVEKRPGLPDRDQPSFLVLVPEY